MVLLNFTVLRCFPFFSHVSTKCFAFFLALHIPTYKSRWLTFLLVHRGAYTLTTGRKIHQSCERPSPPSRGTVGCRGQTCRRSISQKLVSKSFFSRYKLKFMFVNSLQSIKVRVEVFHWDMMGVNGITTCSQQTWWENTTKKSKHAITSR